MTDLLAEVRARDEALGDAIRDSASPEAMGEVIAAYQRDHLWLLAENARLAALLTPERLAAALEQVRRDKVSPEMRREGGWTMLSGMDATAILAALTSEEPKP